MATRGSYVHNFMVKFRGHPENDSFMQFSQNLMVSDKMIHRAFITHKTL